MRLWLRADIEKIVGGVLLVFSWEHVLGLIIGWPVSHMVQEPEISAALYGVIAVVFALMGLQLGSTRLPELGKKLDKRQVEGVVSLASWTRRSLSTAASRMSVRQDSSAGELIIPEFVLKELQAIADSSEALKRTRGRRGLDILHKIQKQAYVSVVISDTDYPAVKEVDLKAPQPGTRDRLPNSYQ